MKVLVLGAAGMAGHVIALYLRENGLNVDTLSSRNSLDKATHLIDVTEASKFQAFLDKNKYDIVINSIALLVKPSEERQDLAIYLNSYLPRFLENYYKDSKTRVIHISTDGVFSGQTSPHREDDLRDGESFYGRTKALGEVINTKDLTFRMSIIGPNMRPDDAGLFNWFYAQKGEVTGFTKAIWNGVTTLELAKAMKDAVDQRLTGLYHLVPTSGSISKFDLLQLFKEIFNLKDIDLLPAEGTVTDNTLINTRTDFRHPVPDYRTMIRDMKAWIERHPKIYKHYEN